MRSPPPSESAVWLRADLARRVAAVQQGSVPRLQALARAVRSHVQHGAWLLEIERSLDEVRENVAALRWQAPVRSWLRARKAEMLAARQVEARSTLTLRCTDILQMAEAFLAQNQRDSAESKVPLLDFALERQALEHDTSRAVRALDAMQADLQRKFAAARAAVAVQALERLRAQAAQITHVLRRQAALCLQAERMHAACAEALGQRRALALALTTRLHPAHARLLEAVRALDAEGKALPRAEREVLAEAARDAFTNALEDATAAIVQANEAEAELADCQEAYQVAVEEFLIAASALHDATGAAQLLPSA